MLRLTERPLAADARMVLNTLQRLVDGEGDFAKQVARAKTAWDARWSSAEKKAAFQTVRRTLEGLSFANSRCAYCEDTHGDEIEHIRPKRFFPGQTFVWENYLLSCGPCNRYKGSRYGLVIDGQIATLGFERSEPSGPPPPALSALIDLRSEDPLDLVTLDLGGRQPDGTFFRGYFNFGPLPALDPITSARAEFSIDLLGLNRSPLPESRETAFNGFQARLDRYAGEKRRGAATQRLHYLRDDLLATPHLTVFAEMRRQQRFLPEIAILFAAAPEAMDWPLVPPVQA